MTCTPQKLNHYSCPKTHTWQSSTRTWQYTHALGRAALVAMETYSGLQLIDQFLYVVKLSHIATTTGYCTTCKCFASLLAIISLFIACDVTEALKCGGLPPLSEKWVGDMSPSAPHPSLMPQPISAGNDE